MVTPYEDWIPQTEEVTLPSGKVALLRRPELVDIIIGDDIPDVLTNMVMDAVNRKTSQSLEEFELTAENMPELLKMFNVIAVACFVDPKVVDGVNAPPPGAILAKWIPFKDRAHVFGWALGAQFQPAATFPEEQTGDVGIVSPGGDVQRESESQLRDTG